MKPLVKIKRIYEPVEKSDGIRILVDRLWPRGIKKEDAAIDEWVKTIAPSDDLRKWFNHDISRWKSFEQKYKQELQANKDIEAFVSSHKKDKVITLLFSAKDPLYNNAVVLQQYLKAML